ncbi:hypothetical protein CROQUDRAFT_90010 [Cronartium quercuum f. sp. fusiforme G11]|uniref:Uncharacterized protein n=1 Tax=Cronartium quercuum f. sp. fusiforme G11 TaxID=708437 RepID=A0A9P6NNE3_9BASI|nr:hypothetical protein CROQUDRAFT_90010 [Cronartium quercuum f. sp. fusiforme G11]
MSCAITRHPSPALNIAIYLVNKVIWLKESSFNEARSASGQPTWSTSAQPRTLELHFKALSSASDSPKLPSHIWRAGGDFPLSTQQVPWDCKGIVIISVNNS